MENDAIKYQLLRTIGVAILSDLIKDKKLDLDKCSDRQYVSTIIELNFPDDFRYVITMNEKLIKSAKSFVESDNWSALILACTAIEHEINYYYTEFLRIRGFSDREIRKIIRGNSFDDKTDWLMKLTTDQKLPRHIQKDLKYYIDLRNRIVHYKSGSGSFNEGNAEASEIDEELEKKLDFEKLFVLINELHDSLESILDEMSPEYKKAKEIVSMLL